MFRVGQFGSATHFRDLKNETTRLLTHIPFKFCHDEKIPARPEHRNSEQSDLPI
jgi:hypothetical protein